MPEIRLVWYTALALGMIIGFGLTFTVMMVFGNVCL
jgi:hypothetical protein